jgi:serine/threonine protein kinase
MGISARLQHVLAGTYRIDSFLGAGGVGLVYAATQLATQERVAVKFLRSELASQPELTRRFIKEAEAAAQLEHPNAVRLIALDKDPKYGLYMVLELLSGESLELHLNRVKRVPLERACEWLLPIVDMLEHAHANGLLHRDIKPANIFLHEPTPGQIVPKLLDFGLVRVMSDLQGLNTKTGQALGTPAHMSPEQARGIKGLQPSSDVWAMAVVLYRCLSGIEPFDRGSVNSTVLAVIRGEYRPLAEVCPDLPRAAALSEVLRRALRVDPKARTQSMALLRGQLLQVVDPEHLRRSGTIRRDRRDRRDRRRLPSAAQVALALAAVGVLVMLLWSVQDAAHSDPAPGPTQTVRVETTRSMPAPGPLTPPQAPQTP